MKRIATTVSLSVIVPAFFIVAALSNAEAASDRPSTAILRGGPVNGVVVGIEPGQKTINLRRIYHAGPGSDEKMPTYVATDEISEHHVVFVYKADKQ